MPQFEQAPGLFAAFRQGVGTVTVSADLTSCLVAAAARVLRTESLLVCSTSCVPEFPIQRLCNGTAVIQSACGCNAQDVETIKVDLNAAAAE